MWSPLTLGRILSSQAEMIPTVCGWHNLGDDLQLKILSVFKQEGGDKDSLNALLQTSRALRILVSSLIHKIKIRSIDALAKFPRHATINAMELNLIPQLGLELPAMLTWLVIASSAGTRLNSVIDISVRLCHHSNAPQMDAASVAPFISAIGQACPNLQGLAVGHLDVHHREPIVALFSAIGLHLPNLTSLKISIPSGSNLLSDWNIDWAASLPRSLQILHLPSNYLHHELLQHLLQMPQLEEVEARSIIGASADRQQALQSDACTWRRLKLFIFPSFWDVCRFTTWPDLSLIIYPGHPARWTLNPHSPDQTRAVAKAATRLALCSGSMLRDKPFAIVWESVPTDPSLSAGILSALAPMADNIATLFLDNWTITAALLDELAQSLPHTSSLYLVRCTFTSEAWLRLLTLTSVRALYFLALTKPEDRLPEHQVQLVDVVAYTLSVPHAMKLFFHEGCMTASDMLAWKAFVPSLVTRRTLLGVPPLTILPDFK